MRENDKINVCAYCRVSTDSTDQLNSLSNQVRFFTEYVGARPEWRMTEVYYDEGISGTSVKNRNGFNRMLAAAECGEVQLILTKEVSRFARNTVDALSHTRRLREIGVGVIFMSDGIDTRDCDGELRLTIMSSIAQEESRKTSERVKWGQRRRMEQGAVFGSAPFGFRLDGKKLVVDKSEAEIVRRVFLMFAEERKSTYAIAAVLDEQRVRPRRAEKWTSASVCKLLRNEKYVGDLCQGKTTTPDFLTHKKTTADIKNAVYISGHHDSIISRELWERTQELLKARGKKKKQSVRYWCSGKIFCEKCGAKYVSRVIGSYTAWRCGNGAKHGKKGCENPSVNMKILRAAMLFLLNSLVGYDIALATLSAEQINETDTHVKSERERLKKRLESAVELALDGYIDKARLEKIRGECEKKLSALDGNEYSKSYTDAEEILDIMYSSPDEILRAVTEKITVGERGALTVRLIDIDEDFKLQWAAGGKGESYRVNVNYAQF